MGTFIPRPDIEKKISDYYGSQYPVHIIQDNNFNPPGYGDIETMLKEDAIYNNGSYIYKNPFPNENTIVFNNKVRNPETASILDYLHVLRSEDSYYKKLLKQLHDVVVSTKGDVYQNALRRRQDDIDRNGQEEFPLSKYIENEEDGWLRNLFHPGSPSEIEFDNYYPDKRQLLEWNPDLYEPTREIYNYLHPYKLPELIVYGQTKSSNP